MAEDHRKTVGVLALQGDFEAHMKSLEQAGARATPVRSADGFKNIDGLVIPGGESTTMLKLLNEMNMTAPLVEFASRKPVFGTCAGAILMAKRVEGPAQESLGLIDLTVERNAYGRQIDSRVARLSPSANFQDRTTAGDLEAVFIRAPIIRSRGKDIGVLAEYQGDPVLVEAGRHLASTFHPELTDDVRVHKLFLSKL